MEGLKYWNIARLSNFNLLSTGEKIKYLLEKDVLYIGKVWSLHNKPNCVSWQNIDFSQFDKRPFDLFDSYTTNDGNHLNINPQFSEEVFEYFQDRISIYYVNYDEYSLNLDLLQSPDEKAQYLSNILKEQNVFKLKNLIVDYNEDSHQLALNHEMAIKFCESSMEIFIDHLMGVDIPLRWYCHNEFIKYFKNEYNHFAIAKWALAKIGKIKSIGQIKEELIEDYGIPNNLNAYQYAYFFESIGFVKQQYNNGISYAEIGRKISELVQLNHTNITNHLRTIRTTDVENTTSMQKKLQAETDIYIKAYS